MSTNNITERAVLNGRYTFKLAWQRALKYNAIPAWAHSPAEKKKILHIYIQAQLKNLSSKKRYQVDHIIPLYGINICGLHTSENLRVISKASNMAKSNTFTPYSERAGRKSYLAGINPVPDNPWKPKKKGRANPTKKSSKKLAKKLIYRRRNFT